MRKCQIPRLLCLGASTMSGLPTVLAYQCTCHIYLNCFLSVCKVYLGYVKGPFLYTFTWLIINPCCIYWKPTVFPPPQAVTVTTTPSAVVSTRLCTRPVDGGVEVCVKVVCTTPQGQNVSSVPQATSLTPTAEWTVQMPAYVSVPLVKATWATHENVTVTSRL